MRAAILPVLAALSFSPQSFAQDCDIVERGSILDGVTTVADLVPETDCVAPSVQGWRCLTIVSTANSNGVQYEIELRWNLADQAAAGTFCWLAGGEGREFLRDISLNLRNVQDELALTDDVRSIEMRFLNLAGYAELPRNGFTNISAVTADVLEFLQTRGLLEGTRGFVAQSRATEMLGHAMAYHDAAALLDGVVMAAGPYFVDLRETCTNPASPIYGEFLQKTQADTWNWRSLGDSPCFEGAADPTPDYDCRSLLGSLAQVDFPDLSCDIAIGTDDDAWNLVAADYYMAGLAVRSGGVVALVGGHSILNEPVGADWALERVRAILAASTTCAGDVNGDGVVNLADLGVLLANFGAVGVPREQGDLDDDGDVDLADLGVLLAAFGAPCG